MRWLELIKLDDQKSGLSGTHDPESALRIAVAERGSDFIDLGSRWRTEVLSALRRLQKTAKKNLDGEHVTAVKLQIEMHHDLLEYMPDPTTISLDSTSFELNRLEPARVRDEIVLTARFIEWLLFRKYDGSPQEIAELFDLSDLYQVTAIYCRLLTAIENDARSLLASGSLLNTSLEEIGGRDQSLPKHLRLID